MVGIVSSSNVPSVMALTSVVFPAFWSPTMAIYNYLLKNLDFIQSNNLLKKPNIFVFVVLLFINCYKKYTKSTNYKIASLYYKITNKEFSKSKQN